MCKNTSPSLHLHFLFLIHNLHQQVQVVFHPTSQLVVVSRGCCRFTWEWFYRITMKLVVVVLAEVMTAADSYHVFYFIYNFINISHFIFLQRGAWLETNMDRMEGSGRPLTNNLQSINQSIITRSQKYKKKKTGPQTCCSYTRREGEMLMDSVVMVRVVIAMATV